MSMNISSSIISGIGISLGGMNTAIDFLYANAEVYEAELNEIKSITIDADDICIDTETPKNVIINKPIKPKISKEGIIKKYSLHILGETKRDNEEVIDVGFVEDIDDFDFSFDDLTPQISEADEEANDLLFRLNMAGQELSLGGINEVDESEEDILQDMIDDIEEDSDNMDNKQNEQLESINENEVDIDFEEDESLDENEDNLDIDDLLNDIDEDDSDNMDDAESYFDSIDELDIEEDGETDEEEDDLSDIDSLDFDDNDDNFIDEDDEQNSEIISNDDIELTDDEFDINIDIDDNIDIDSNSNEISTNNTIANNSDTDKDREIEQLKQQIAAMKKHEHDIEEIPSSNKASNIYDDKVKSDTNDDVDKLIQNANGASGKQKPKIDDRYERYNNMPADVLFKEVHQYMLSLGVTRRLIDIAPLYDKFGESNIKRLIHKSYLIRTGKGVTTGL